ncbi:MAG: hypothetical protein KC418_07595 [Anaerolineales bacterium]|nr:hypothetical protein [Anaerolineales bacterium]MCB8952806.1 hypothetical protein [Ardenticatenales bacterium]
MTEFELRFNYDFHFWWAHTTFCRDLARQVNVSMRALDPALWQYSRENQQRKC